MNTRTRGLLVLLIVIVLIGAAYVLIFPGTHTGGEAAQAILDKEVLGNGATIHLSVKIISRSDTEFSNIRIVVDSPSDHRVVVNLTDISWTENHSQVYPTSDGFSITLSRNGSHDFLLKGDSFDISSTSEKLAIGNWTVTIVYIPTGSVVAHAEQTID